jgi:hypothetical protein
MIGIRACGAFPRLLSDRHPLIRATLRNFSLGLGIRANLDRMAKRDDPFGGK